MNSNKIYIIAGTFHKKESEIMINEAKKTAEAKGLEVVDVIKVPGSLEVPIVLKNVLKKADIAGAAVLGIIERGETKHGFVMGQSVTSAIIDLELEFNKPVGYGIIGPEVLPPQIEPRLIPHAQNAVNAIAEVLDILNKLD